MNIRSVWASSAGRLCKVRTHSQVGDDGRPARICVVGSGSSYLSGISYYTYYIADALSEKCSISVILMRKLIPRRLYPGRQRVGSKLTNLDIATKLPTYDGVDWYGFPSIFKASLFMKRRQPDIVIFQWWTGAVLPWYLMLGAVARWSGALCILELHESQDSGEASIPGVKGLVSLGRKLLVRQCSAFIVHSEFDRRQFATSMDIWLFTIEGVVGV
jgi:hypothetical protein